MGGLKFWGKREAAGRKRQLFSSGLSSCEEIWLFRFRMWQKENVLRVPLFGHEKCILWKHFMWRVRFIWEVADNKMLPGSGPPDVRVARAAAFHVFAMQSFTSAVQKSDKVRGYQPTSSPLCGTVGLMYSSAFTAASFAPIDQVSLDGLKSMRGVQ